jgi:hypothetical protein
MALESAELAFVQCDRTLMGIPGEMLALILEHVVGDKASIIYVQESGKGHLYWLHPWVLNLMLVSKDFGAVAKKAITKAARLVFRDRDQKEAFRDAVRNGASEDWKGMLSVDHFPSYLRSKAPLLEIVQDKVLSGGVCDHLTINAFSSLRTVTLAGGIIEDWAEDYALLLVAVAIKTPRPMVVAEQKLSDMADVLLDTELLSPSDRAAYRAVCQEHLTKWRSSMLDALEGVRRKNPIPRNLQQALVFRLRAGVASTEALLKRICEVNMGIARSCITGLGDSTVLRVVFQTISDGKQKGVSSIVKHSSIR